MYYFAPCRTQIQVGKYYFAYLVLLLSAFPIHAGSVKLQLADWKSDACPSSFARHITLNSQPLHLEIEELSLDIGCLLDATSSNRGSNLSPAEIKSLIEQGLQQLQNLPFAGQALHAKVNHLHIQQNQASLLQGSLLLSSQDRRWQLQVQSPQSIDINLEFNDEGQDLSGDIKVNTKQYPHWTRLFPHLATLPAPLTAPLALTFQGELFPHLNLQSTLSAAQQTLAMRLQQWNHWQLALSAPAQQWQTHALPAWHANINQHQWSWHAPHWQLQAKGQWQALPEWQLKGQLQALDLTAINQDLALVALPNQLFSGQASVEFSGSPQQLHMNYQVNNLNALWQEYPISQLSLSGEIHGKHHQQLHHQGNASVDSVDIGTLLTQGQAHWQSQQAAPINHWQNLQLSQVQAQALGGVVHLDPLKLDFPSQSKLQLSNIQLSHIAQLYPELALFMEGSLDGTLPVSFQPDGIAILQGNLAINDQGGHIALSHQAVESLKLQHPMLEFSLGLLEDFNYKTLAAELDFTQDGDLDMQVSLSGHNPKVTPREVKFNYRHQENIYQLLRSLRIGEQLSGHLEQWIDAASSASAAP